MHRKQALTALSILCLMIGGCTSEPVPATPTPTLIETIPLGTKSALELLPRVIYPTTEAQSITKINPDHSDLLPDHSIFVHNNHGAISPYNMRANLEPRHIVVGSEVSIFAVGYQAGGQVSTHLIAPDETTSTQQITVDGGGSWGMNWVLKPGSPVGTYKLIIASDSGTETITFPVMHADAPFIHSECGEGDQLDVYLLGFNSGEVVQVGLYTGDNLVLQESRTITVDNNGEASATLFNPNKTLIIVVAVGTERSYEVQDGEGNSMQVTALDMTTCIQL